MFKSDRTARVAILMMMAFFAVGALALFVANRPKDINVILGLELIFIWAYLNPWIMQTEYSIPLFLDYNRMQHNYLAIAGMVVVLGSVVMMVW